MKELFGEHSKRDVNPYTKELKVSNARILNVVLGCQGQSVLECF